MRDFRRLICPALYAAVPAASLRAASKRFARFADCVSSELPSKFRCIDVCVCVFRGGRRRAAGFKSAAEGA